MSLQYSAKAEIIWVILKERNAKYNINIHKPLRI